MRGMPIKSRDRAKASVVSKFGGAGLSERSQQMTAVAIKSPAVISAVSKNRRGSIRYSWVRVIVLELSGEAGVSTAAAAC